MDEIVRQVRDAREAYAAKFAFNLEAIHRDLAAKQRQAGRTIVSFAPHQPPQHVRGQATHPKLVESNAK